MKNEDAATLSLCYNDYNYGHTTEQHARSQRQRKLFTILLYTYLSAASRPSEHPISRLTFVDCQRHR